MIVSHYYTPINERSCVLFFFKYRPLVDNEHARKIRYPRVGARMCLYYVLCVSVIKLFLVLFKYFIVIIKKVEMLYVVLNKIEC